MHIAIDVGPTKSGDAVRGVGVYTRELVSALKKIQVPTLELDEVDAKKDDLSKYDLLHIPYFQPFFLTLPAKKKTITVVTIHDAIPLIYPKAYPPGIKGSVILQLQKLRLRQIDHIITVSETSKKDIVRLLGISPEKITVIYEGPRDVFKQNVTSVVLNEVKKKYNLPERFVLYVGDVNYNKNILTLAKACKMAKTPLVIAGKSAVRESVDFSHPENEPFKKFLDVFGKDKDILRLGFVEDDDLVSIYRLASMYCQPSYYEGFGLVVVEAMMTETPVIVAKTNALTEVAGEAAIVADPDKPEEFAKAISQIMSDKKLRSELVQKGKHRVKTFSWDRMAQETFDLYKKVLGK